MARVIQELHDYFALYDVDLPIGCELGVENYEFKRIISACFCFLNKDEQIHELLVEMTPDSENDEHFIKRNRLLINKITQLESYFSSIRCDYRKVEITRALVLLRLMS